MNSINKNQPEENHSDLRGQEAIAKLKSLVDSAKTCFFCTGIAAGDINSTRPMSVRKVDDDGNLWFLSASDSRHNHDLASDPTVKLYFQGSSYSDFLHLNGHATVTTDKAKIKELWEPMIKVWFTEGIEDPRITVIKVAPTNGYYWTTKHGYVVVSIKMLIGTMLGKTFDDSIEGKLKIG